MDDASILTLFASKFVKRTFRERFVHEALRKPRKLHSRICHNITQVFDDSFANGRCAYSPDDECLVLNWGSKIIRSTWREALQEQGAGGGLLIVDCTGAKFYAETEAEHGSPSVAFASG